MTTNQTPKAFVPNFEKSEARTDRKIKMQEKLRDAMREAAKSSTTNTDGQEHTKLNSPVYYDQDYMPPGLTPETLNLGEVHKLDHGAAVLGAHGEFVFERMSADSNLRKVNTVTNIGPGQDIVATTYRTFTTHNPQKPEDKLVIHGHTNLAFRQSFTNSTSDIGKEKAAITANFTKAFGEA